MKRIHCSLTIFSLLLAFATVAGAQGLQIRGGGIYYEPSGAAATGSEISGLGEIDWDSGTGLELQGIYWMHNSPWGIGASFGMAEWEIDDYEDRWVHHGRTYDDVITGDAELSIIGVSLFYKLFENHGASGAWNGHLEGGVRFVSVDSNIRGTTAVNDGGRTPAIAQTIDIDDSVLGVFGFDVSLALSDTISLFGHAGIQFDLDQGDAHRVVPGLGTWEAGETEMFAVYGKGGLSIAF